MTTNKKSPKCDHCNKRLAKTLFYGVYKGKTRSIAVCQLGYFSDPQSAADAYDVAARKRCSSS